MKRREMKRGNMLRWIIVFVGFFALTSAHSKIQEIADRFYQWRMENNPEYASNNGDMRYMDEVEDYSLEAIDARKVDMEGYITELNALPRQTLSFEDRVTYDVLRDTIQTWLDGYEWKDYGPMNPINILEGIHSQLSDKAGRVTITTPNDYRRFAVRIGKFAVQVTQIITRMRRAIEMKTTNHMASIEGIPEKIQTDVLDKYNGNETAIPLYKPFLSTMDSKVSNATERAEIRNLAVQNIKSLLARLSELKTFLTDEYIPNTRSSFGVWGLPRGTEYYAACLKWQLSVNLTADEIHDLGLREVERVYGELEKIVKRANFDGTVRAYNDHLRKDTSLFINNEDEAMQRFKSFHETRIKPKLNLFFEDIPWEIELVIQKMTYNGPNGIYKNGSPDMTRPGIFYANVMGPVPTFDMAALLLHETDPGHHLQDAYALTASGIPEFRKSTDFSKYFAVPLHYPFYTAYSEGWGLYAEDLGEELQIYKNDLEMFGKYGLEIFRAARLVVDTGIHAKRWSKERAIEYMVNYTAYHQDFITREINRYSTWPAQATSYMVGKLKIWELRNYASRNLCAHFHLKPFHSIILKNGAMPLSVMENLVREWVSQVRQDNGITGDCSYTWANGVGTLHKTPWVAAVMTIFVIFANLF